ncbi:MarR family transcriptional regulator [Streptomyces sp. NPDC002463]|uniref:MarR family transcriptional regulator n=1 Tax=Streptomyces sp. NPDC002463 TaxID=3364645 RepID=UPI0036C2DC1A
MTSTTPAADAQLLGLAHYAARGVLEHVLSRHGITFTQHIVLRAATTKPPQTPEDLITQVHTSLKINPDDIRTVLDELRSSQLLTANGRHLGPTAPARELLTAIAVDVAPVAARIWGGIPAEDLAAAGRVLALVADRANTELATLTA